MRNMPGNPGNDGGTWHADTDTHTSGGRSPVGSEEAVDSLFNPSLTVSDSDTQPYNLYEQTISDDPMQTGRDNAGPLSQGQWNDKTMFRLGGMEVQVRSAVAAGLVEEAGNGRYALTEKGARLGGVPFAGSSRSDQGEGRNTHQQDDSQADEDQGSMPYDQTGQAILADLKGHLTGIQMHSAADSIIKRGELPGGLLDQLASQAHVRPEALAANVQHLRANLESQYNATMGAAGVPDLDTFTAWAHQNKPQDMQKAMKDQVMFGKTSGYRALATEFMASLDEAMPDEVLSAKTSKGLEVYRHPSGRTMVYHPSIGEMSYSVAVRKGFIKVRKA